MRSRGDWSIRCSVTPRRRSSATFRSGQMMSRLASSMTSSFQADTSSDALLKDRRSSSFSRALSCSDVPMAGGSDACAAPRLRRRPAGTLRDPKAGRLARSGGEASLKAKMPTPHLRTTARKWAIEWKGRGEGPIRGRGARGDEGGGAGGQSGQSGRPGRPHCALGGPWGGRQEGEQTGRGGVGVHCHGRAEDDRGKHQRRRRVPVARQPPRTCAEVQTRGTRTGVRR